MKPRHLSAKGNIKKPVPPSGVTDIVPVPKKPAKKPAVSDTRETHNAPSREEIQQTAHRTTPSRQSQRPLERTGQHRKHHGKGSGPKK